MTDKEKFEKWCPKKVTMVVTMEVTPPQALALEAMFRYWNNCAGVGRSRYVGFNVDGDGDFHPNCRFTQHQFLPELNPEMKNVCVVEDKDGDRTYDYDRLAWGLHYGGNEYTGERIDVGEIKLREKQT